VSKINYSLGFKDIRYQVAINLVRLEAMVGGYVVPGDKQKIS
jgi:hypothetical protein